MTDTEDTVLDNIRKYAADTAVVQRDRMEVEDAGRADIETRIDRTLEQLQKRVKEQEDALRKLRATSQAHSISKGRSTDPRVRVKQYRILVSSYQQETQKTPYLPEPDSVLPSLLAARLTEQTISGLKASIKATRANLATTGGDVRTEEADLSDAASIKAALQNRLAKLRDDQQVSTHVSALETVKGRIEAHQKQNLRYSQESGRLRELLDGFIEQHLAAMLAAEELGGPVVGDIMDVDDETLAAGFSHQGKPKSSAAARRVDQDTRQRRIDQIWGPASEDDGQETRSEKEIAATDLQDLIDELLEALLGAASTSPYVELERDSAAARFLVRAKVAQLHPKDARKLRLVDFGRELDD